MAQIDVLIGSDAWSDKWDLPTFPLTNNGWLYCAYALKMVRKDPNFTNRVPLVIAVKNLFITNRVAPGLYKRIESDIDVSHDELLGMGYLSYEYGYQEAVDILNYLKRKNWVYDVQGDDPWYKRWVYRISDIPAFMKQVGSPWYLKLGKRSYGPNLIDQIRYALTVFFRARSKDPGMSHHLRTWITSDILSEYTICNWAIKYWKRKLKERNISLATMMKEYFPNIPQMEILALITGNEL